MMIMICLCIKPGLWGTKRNSAFSSRVSVSDVRVETSCGNTIHAGLYVIHNAEYLVYFVVSQQKTFTAY